MPDMPEVAYAPFVSQVDPSFWSELGVKKLEEYKLSEEAHPICGTYSVCTAAQPQAAAAAAAAGVRQHGADHLPPLLTMASSAFKADGATLPPHTPPRDHAVHGWLHNANTLER